MVNNSIRFILPILIGISTTFLYQPPKAEGQVGVNGRDKRESLQEGALGSPSKGTIEESSVAADSKPLWPSDDESIHLTERPISDTDSVSDAERDTKDSPHTPQSGSVKNVEPTAESSINIATQHSSSLTESDEEWKLDLAKKEYAREPNDLSLTEVLSAYAELINSDCFAQKKPSCGRLIEESLRLDPFFTPAICSQHGFESKLCLESFGSLRLGIIEDSETSISRKLTLSLDESRQAEALRTMHEQRWNLMQQFKQNQTQEGLSGILKMFFKELALVCNREQFFVETIKKTNEEPVKSEDALTILLLATPTPTPIPGGFLRWRRITKACRDLADEALSFAPDFSSAMCAKFGRYSPKCNQSLRNAQIQKIPVPGNPFPGSSSQGSSQSSSSLGRNGLNDIRGSSTNEGLEEF